RVTPTTRAAYDAAGNVVRTWDAVGVATRTDYDDLNRKTRVVEAEGTSKERTTTYRYDAADNVTQAVSGAAPQDTSYQHLTTTVYAYDELNRQRTVTQAAGAPAGDLGHPSPVTSI